MPRAIPLSEALAAVHRSLGLDAWEPADWAGAVDGPARQLDGDSVDEHALASERAGDLVTALHGFERALELDPASAPAAEGAARTRAALGERAAPSPGPHATWRVGSPDGALGGSLR